MKKVFIIFFILILMCTLLTGCKRSKNEIKEKDARGCVIIDKLYENKGRGYIWFAFVIKDDEGKHKVIWDVNINTYYSYKIGDIYMGD